MKDNHLTGLGVSAAIHVGLALLLAPVLFAQEPKQEEPPVLPVELSMFAPPAPEPVQEPAPSLRRSLRPHPRHLRRPNPNRPKNPSRSKTSRWKSPCPNPSLRKTCARSRKCKSAVRNGTASGKRNSNRRRCSVRNRRASKPGSKRVCAPSSRRRAAAQAQNETPLITNPSYRRPPRPPEYPRRALEAGVEGVVVVRANVSAGGNVTAARVHQSSGNAALDAAAVKAVRGWSFVPASRGGRSIESIVQTPVRFKIN
ncbi:MAG: TonB family protein [Candidatus Thiothrix singaporensis]|uniref:TonB family protein n=1 Tax=Candidatus Thiothrix singaporensis TaxID=2799669 RepID=A0A7L6AUJ9_9GAMM|nr:MAG: TonB family protein [Candidatus Thiothrix singaporensis]